MVYVSRTWTKKQPAIDFRKELKEFWKSIGFRDNAFECRIVDLETDGM